ncbi:hypothetical protein BOTBODRAFT_206128 [Botryobasidium botryosum FD-172 SS1]|uniref:Uncharacterized protein n=1 Tax=Botryobasidium botryosum (strain FD-172 SS1) TaxID=930990 RepID=A0A067N3I7_BOTB1|nr:hypothetical protein BOTBODRAFT_206128 [Botryobasidium botryosum FD-172 SS1]
MCFNVLQPSAVGTPLIAQEGSKMERRIKSIAPPFTRFGPPYALYDESVHLQGRRVVNHRRHTTSCWRLPSTNVAGLALSSLYSNNTARAVFTLIGVLRCGWACTLPEKFSYGTCTVRAKHTTRAGDGTLADRSLAPAELTRTSSAMLFPRVVRVIYEGVFKERVRHDVVVPLPVASI